MKRHHIIATLMLLCTLTASAQEPTVDVLIDEDFSGLTDGTEDAPAEEQVFTYLDEGWYWIPPEKMHGLWWTGYGCFPAGGALAILSPGLSDCCILNGPLGDYSGEITITYRAKALDVEGNARVLVSTNINAGGYVTGYATGGLGEGITYKMFGPDDGWQDIEFHTFNRNADNQGFIQIQVYGKVIIDDMKVTVRNSMIAPPVLNEAADFLSDGFTVSWQPVRRADDYTVQLYERRYTSDADQTYDEHFDNLDSEASNLPEGYDLQQASTPKLTADGGRGGSQAVILRAGDHLAMPVNGGRYRYGKFWIKAVVPEGTEGQGEIFLDWNNGEEWLQNNYLTLGQLADWTEVNASDLIYGFNNATWGFRIRVSEAMPEGVEVLIDDVSFATGPSCEYDAVGDAIVTTETSHVFTGLDPMGEYCYRVTSRHQDLTGSTLRTFAFGLPTPATQAPTNVTSDGYTARWEPVAKATRYVVRNYGVADAERVIMDEEFSKVDRSVTSSTSPQRPTALGNTEEISLDDYTDSPGWTGIDVIFSRGMLGAAGSPTTQNYIRTPKLYLANAEECDITIRAYGEPGDALGIRDENENEFYLGFDESGFVGGTYTIPTGSKAETLEFFTVNRGSFLIDRFCVEQQPQGDAKVYKYLSAKTVSGETLEAAFTGLGQKGYKDYAFTVTALWDLDGQRAQSLPSDYVAVSLPTNIQNIEHSALNNDHSSAATYDLGGRSVGRLGDSSFGRLGKVTSPNNQTAKQPNDQQVNGQLRKGVYIRNGKKFVVK